MAPLPGDSSSSTSNNPPSTSSANSLSINGAAGRAAATGGTSMNVLGASAAAGAASSSAAGPAPAPPPVASTSKTPTANTAPGGRSKISFGLKGAAGGKAGGNPLSGLKINKTASGSPTKSSPPKPNPLKQNPLAPSEAVKDAGKALQDVLGGGGEKGKSEEDMQRERELERKAVEELRNASAVTGAAYGAAGGGGSGRGGTRRVSGSPALGSIALPGPPPPQHVAQEIRSLPLPPPHPSLPPLANSHVHPPPPQPAHTSTTPTVPPPPPHPLPSHPQPAFQSTTPTVPPPPPPAASASTLPPAPHLPPKPPVPLSAAGMERRKSGGGGGERRRSAGEQDFPPPHPPAAVPVVGQPGPSREEVRPSEERRNGAAGGGGDGMARVGMGNAADGGSYEGYGGYGGGGGGYGGGGYGGGAPNYRPRRSPSPEYHHRRRSPSPRRRDGRRSPSPFHPSGVKPGDEGYEDRSRNGHYDDRDRNRGDSYNSRQRSPQRGGYGRYEDDYRRRDEHHSSRSHRSSYGQQDGGRYRDEFRSRQHDERRDEHERGYKRERSPRPPPRDGRPRSPAPLPYGGGGGNGGLDYGGPTASKPPQPSSTPSGESPPPKRRKQPSRSPPSDSDMEYGSEEGEEKDDREKASPRRRSVVEPGHMERLAERVRSGERELPSSSGPSSRFSTSLPRPAPLPSSAQNPPAATASPSTSSRRPPPPPPPPQRSIPPPPLGLPPRPEDPGAPFHPPNLNSLPSGSGQQAVLDRTSGVRSSSAMQMSPSVGSPSTSAAPTPLPTEDIAMAERPAPKEYAPPKVRIPNPNEEEYFRAPRDDEFDAAFAADLDPSEIPAIDAALENRKYIGSSHIREYTLQEKLGEGTFGVVWKGIRGRDEKEKAKERGVAAAGQPAGFAAVKEQEERARERKEEDELVKKGLRVRRGDVVALKQIIYHNINDGMPITSIREIRILKMLDHPNVVPVVDIALDPADPAEFKLGKTYMVFPYMDHDLAGLLENPRVKLEPGHIKQYAKQLLEGTAYLHRNLILHRDMKAANLLISNKGQLMIADFGLARSVEKAAKNAAYTSCVVTRWYRPPELLLNAKHYHAPIDMWGVGCVLAEMYHRIPIFPGSSDMDQLARIFALCGSPTPENFPGWDELPGVEGFEKTSWRDCGRSVSIEWERRSQDALFGDLMDKLLVLDPKKRLTAEEALDHDWFWTAPYPTEPSQMPQYNASHEMDRQTREKAGQPSTVPQPQALPPPLAYGQPGLIQPPPPPPMGFPPPVSAFNGPPPPVGAFNGPPPPVPPPPGYGGNYPPPPPLPAYGGGGGGHGHGHGGGGGGGPGQGYQSFAAGGMRPQMSRGGGPGPGYGGGGPSQQWQSGGRGGPMPGGARGGGGINLLSRLKKN